MNDDEKFYLENEKLVYKFATEKKCLFDEDIIQNLKLALWRAVKSYDETKNIAFSTYAYQVMFNEYNYRFRDRHLKLKFVNNQIYDKEEKLISIFELLPDNTSNIESFIENKELYNIINEYLDSLSIEEKEIYTKYYYEEISQKELSKLYNITQPNISRLLKHINKNLQKLLKDFK